MDMEIMKDFLDTKFPLLEKFREVAPGTFKHSMNVRSLCESVALELNLDIILMNVVGMYHDIGKMDNPIVFSENQNGCGNIHDELEPSISYQLITRHVGDTALRLLQVFNMPRNVMEIVSQHHGNSVLRFFYEKSGAESDEMYRYKSIAPQSLEAAVLMICDSVEATAKAKHNNNGLNETKDKKTVVSSTIQRLMDDDQLDNLKVGELKIIKRILFRELENIYHKREIYPENENIDDEDKIKVEDID